MDVKELKELLTSKSGNYLFAIDGNCGSGKTTLANELKNVLGIQVVHVDDFYLPFAKRAEDWFYIDGGNIDFDRLIKTVVEPYLNDERVEYYRYNAHADEIIEHCVLDPDKPLCVEGSYSCHEVLRKYYVLKIFLTCNKEEQLRRLTVRQGGDISGFIEKWIPKEENYFKNQKVFDNCDFVISTDD